MEKERDPNEAVVNTQLTEKLLMAITVGNGDFMEGPFAMLNIAFVGQDGKPHSVDIGTNKNAGRESFVNQLRDAANYIEKT